MDFMFADPTMLDDFDFLFKSDMARRLMFYYQEEWKPDPPIDKSKLGSREKHDDIQRPNLLKVQGKGKQKQGGKKTLTVQDGTELPLNGISVYILRSSSKRALGEETFQREIMLGILPESKVYVLDVFFKYRNGGC